MMRTIALLAFLAPIAAAAQPATGLYCPDNGGAPIDVGLSKPDDANIDGMDCRGTRYAAGRLRGRRCFTNSSTDTGGPYETDLVVRRDGTLLHGGVIYRRRGPELPVTLWDSSATPTMQGRRSSMRLRPYSLQDIARRRAAAQRDTNLLASGWTPDAATLADAPFLDEWSETTYPGTDQPALTGIVSGHPRLGPGAIWTSPILARGDGWARSEGRFFRLGERRLGPPKPTVDELVDLLESVPVPQPTGPADPDDGLPSY